MWLAFVVCIIFLLNSCDLDNMPKDLIGILIMCQSGIFPPKPIFSKCSLHYMTVALNQGRLHPPGDIWQCLGTFLLVTSEGMLLTSRGYRLGMLTNIS